MLKNLFPLPPLPAPANCREGELYKIIHVHGKSFPIYYGYYEECDRLNPAVEPMPIYPDFLKAPQYTEEGMPFVTKMQDACHYYKGSQAQDRDCAECKYYQHGDELLGVCSCIRNRITPTTQNKTD